MTTTSTQKQKKPPNWAAFLFELINRNNKSVSLITNA